MSVRHTCRAASRRARARSSRLSSGVRVPDDSPARASNVSRDVERPLRQRQPALIGESPGNGARRKRGVTQAAGLNTGFLVGGQHVLGRAEGDAVTTPFVQVEDPAGLGGEAGVAGKEPTPNSPGLDGVGGEPAPDRGAAELRGEALGEDGPPERGPRPLRERERAPASSGSGSLTVCRRW